MADVILRIINEGVTEATAGVSGVGKAYDDLSKKSKVAGDTQSQAYKDSAKGAEQFNKILADSKPTVQLGKQRSELQKLKQEIKDYTSAAIKAGSGTKEFANALAEAGKRKADLKDLQTTLNQLDPDKKAQAFLQLGQTILTGFAAGTGALQAFGVTTEDAQKTLVKLQAALAFGQFLGQLGELKDTFSNIRVAIQGSEVAQKAFNLVAKANPYVLIGTAIVGVIAALSLFDDALEDDTDAFIKNSDVINAAKKAREDFKSELMSAALALEEANGILTASDVKTISLIQKRDAKKKELQEQLNEELKKIDSSFASNLKKAAIDRDQEEINRLNSQKKKEKDATIKAIQDQFADIKTATSNQLEVIANEEIKSDADKNAKLKEGNSKAYEASLKAKEKSAQDQADIALKFHLQEIADAQASSIQQIADAQQTAIDLAELGNKQIADRLEAEENGRAALKLIGELSLEDQITIANERIKLAQSIVTSFSAINSIAAAAGADSAEFSKLLAISQIAINTASSISNAIAGATAAAAATGPGAVVFTPIFIATQIATVLGAVAQAVGVISSANVPRPNFWTGGYTGDGGKYDYAGNVHKGEYVIDQQKTRKNRSILDAIQYDDYSKITPLDLSALLKGTGVMINQDYPKQILNSYDNHDQRQIIIKSESDKRLANIEKKFDKLLNQQASKEQHTDTSDGHIIKKGNVTRIIRRRKL